MSGAACCKLDDCFVFLTFNSLLYLMQLPNCPEGVIKTSLLYKNGLAKEGTVAFKTISPMWRTEPDLHMSCCFISLFSAVQRQNTFLLL